MSIKEVVGTILTVRAVVHDLGLPGPFTSRRMEPVDILEDDPRAAARTLDRWLGRSRFRSCSR